MKKAPSEGLSVAVFWSPVAGQEGFQGKAAAISSENKLGLFDILPEHTNFISLIFNRLIIHTLDNKRIEYKFSRGVLEVGDNQIRVFLGI